MTELECIPFGVGHAKEGVCLLLQMGPYRILCDCGLSDLRSLLSPSQPALDHNPESDPPWPADFVLCSHAHPDHARGLLALHQAFPTLPLYASEVTTQLLPLNWPSILALRHPPPFAQGLPWRTPTELAPGLTIELYPAGHLPGATAFLLTYIPEFPKGGRTYTAFYTGDFLLSNSRLVDGLPLSELRGLSPDVLILEGSFGTARHPHRRQQENRFAERVMQALGQGQSVLIPVPILGLAQELLMLMRSHHTFTGKNLDIWVEASIAQGCDAYLDLLPSLPPTVQNFAQHQALFWDERVRPRVRRLGEEGRSQRLEQPCIVLVSETTPLHDYCTQSTIPWLVLLPEHRPQTALTSVPDQDPLLPEGVPAFPKGWETLIPSETVSLDTFLLAEHCDGAGTTQLIHNLRPQHVVFVHGSPAYLTDLISLDELANRYHLHAPGVGNRLELPIGEGLIQPPVPTELETVFDGTVQELASDIIATLPCELAADPRWRSFADTGLIEATWQGETLVLRGISQRELMMSQYRPQDPSIKACLNCKHYRNQRCWNNRSSLYSSKVAPEGHCPVFEMSRTPSRDLPQDGG